jgi:hypothetical protein
MAKTKEAVTIVPAPAAQSDPPSKLLNVEALKDLVGLYEKIKNTNINSFGLKVSVHREWYEALADIIKRLS